MAKYNKIIDIHGHIFPDSLAPKVVNTLENYYKMPWQRKGTIADLINSMDEANVAKCVVFSTPTKPEQVTNVNNFLINNKENDRFICFGSVHPKYHDYIGEIKRIKENGLKGFKFHPDFQYFYVDEPDMLKIYEEIGDQYPIIIHAGDKNTDYSSPYRFANLLKLFPTHKFIAAHLGGYSEWENAKEHLIGKNIYIDTSSTMTTLSVKETEEIIKMHGVDKVLFATDYPAVSHKYELENFLSMDFKKSEFQKMLYKNAEKLLKIRL